MRIEDALRLAQEAELDLVEVAAQARPPVCKLMDYGKFKYESAQKARESRRNQQLTTIKEQKLRPKIDKHDYETKRGHVRRFLEGGNKVKVTIMFRGREQSRPELGFRLLQRLAEDISDLGIGRGRTQAGRAEHDDGDRSEQEAGKPAAPRRPPPPAPSRADGSAERVGRQPNDAPRRPGASPVNGTVMPKNKTHSGIAKRIKITGRGKLLRQQTGLRHRLEVKSSKETRDLSGVVPVNKADVKRVKKLLGR